MELFRNPPKRGAHYYFEFGGGLGDVFNGLCHRGSRNLLDNLKEDERPTVALICHNPYAQELFEHHPKRSRISILNLGYWNLDEDARMRAEHKLPRPGGLKRLPQGPSGPVRFYPSEKDKQVLAQLDGWPYVVLAPAAGESNRNISEPLLDLIARRLLKIPGLRLVLTGRNYQRFDRTEIVPPPIPSPRAGDCEAGPSAGRGIQGAGAWSLFCNMRVINLVDQLSVPGTAVLLQGALGLVTCHSALNILGWHLGIPQLLLYPEAVRDRHFRRKDQWSFGVDNGKTWHSTFQEFHPKILEGFLKGLHVPPVPRGKPWVTVSVVCHNNLELTQRCLRSICEHSERFDLVITDNASTDGTWEWLQQFAKDHSNVKLIRNEENLGFIKPHNHALTLARGDYFVILNNDLEVCADWLPTMTAAFDQNPRLAICGLDGNCCALDDEMNGVPCAEKLEYVEASCFMIPTALERAFGLFSTYLHFAYGEDSDLSLRIREQGYDIATVDLPIRHVRAATAKQVAKKLDLDLIAAGNHAILKKRRDFRYQVLVIRRAAAGDVLFTTPIVAALKAKWPLSEIRVLTKFPEIFRDSPNVLDASSTEYPRDQFDFVFDLDLAYERRPQMHVLDAYAEACGFELKETHRRLSIHLRPEERRFAAQFAGANLAVIHAGPTAWPGRNWAKDRFEQVIRYLKSRGFDVAVVGRIDNWTFSEVDFNLVGTTTIHELAAILERAKLFFGIDSFPANLAQAVGCPALVLFGAISPEYRLTGNKVIGVQGDSARTPCIGEHHRLLTSISKLPTPRLFVGHTPVAAGDQTFLCGRVNRFGPDGT
jgi:ADP-heptose:LPS heptosyltransferase